MSRHPIPTAIRSLPSSARASLEFLAVARATARRSAYPVQRRKLLGGSWGLEAEH